MKKFLTYLICFLGLLLLFYGALWGRYIYKMHSYSFALPKEKTILVIGDSQTQAAVNDSLIINVCNVSQSHEHYFTVFKRLQLYLDANRQIDTVLLSVTPRFIAKHYDSYFEGTWYAGDATRQYLPYLNWQDWLVLLRNQPEGVLASLVTPISFYYDVTPCYIRNLGYYASADYSRLKEDDGERLLRKDSIYGNLIALEYLHKIVDLCEQRNIKLIALNTPVYQAQKYLRVDYFYRLMHDEFPKLEIWDNMNDTIPDDYRRDINHLNRKGALWYTNMIKDRLRTEMQ